jgi:hypothetical protein
MLKQFLFIVTFMGMLTGCGTSVTTSPEPPVPPSLSLSTCPFDLNLIINNLESAREMLELSYN